MNREQRIIAIEHRNDASWIDGDKSKIYEWKKNCINILFNAAFASCSHRSSSKEKIITANIFWLWSCSLRLGKLKGKSVLSAIKRAHFPFLWQKLVFGWMKSWPVVVHSLIRFMWRYNPYRMQLDKSWAKGMREPNEDSTTNQKKKTKKNDHKTVTHCAIKH